MIFHVFESATTTVLFRSNVNTRQKQKQHDNITCIIKKSSEVKTLFWRRKTKDQKNAIFCI